MMKNYPCKSHIYHAFCSIGRHLRKRQTEDTATERLLPAVHGASAREHALFKELIFTAFTVKKKMCSFKVCTEEKNLGWACLTSTQKERLYGPMEPILTSITGQTIDQTTLPIRIACIFWVFFKIMTMNGMISTARTVTDLLVRKLSQIIFLVLWEGVWWAIYILKRP